MDSYAELFEAVKSTLHRSDIDEDIARFIRMGETRLYRNLMVPEQRRVQSGVVDEPDGKSLLFGGLISRIDAIDGLSPVTYNQLVQNRFLYPSANTQWYARPERFPVGAAGFTQVSEGTAVTRVWINAGTIGERFDGAVYRIPNSSLAGAADDGLGIQLLRQYPSLFLNAALVEAYKFERNDQYGFMLQVLEAEVTEANRSQMELGYGSGLKATGASLWV